MLPLMNLIITKWLLVYVLENKHNFYVIHFLSLTVYPFHGQPNPSDLIQRLVVKGM